MVDEGIGISQADQERVFERFYRVDPARSRETGGTGLGLSIVKHVAADHGGDVTVWSQPGRGSTFTLRLPRVRTARRPAPATTPTPTRPDHAQTRRRPGLRRRRTATSQHRRRSSRAQERVMTRILVVEDEESYRDPLTYQLRA